MTTLREATTAIHHGAEQTPFGHRMATGIMDMQEWADWLAAMHIIHDRIDAHLPECLRRSELLREDLRSTGKFPNQLMTARGIAVELDKGDAATALGFCYVCSGANLRGGQVIRKVIGQRYPCRHLEFDDFVEPNAWFDELKQRLDLVQPTQKAFAAILGVMGEIDGLKLCRTSA